MTRVLVLHGLGMEQRGKVQIDIFGPLTLPEYDAHIRSYAAELGLEVDIFHSNLAGEVIARLRRARSDGVAAVLFNPAGYSRDHPAVAEALAETGLPAIELHVSNPLRRVVPSDSIKVSTGAVVGFGIFGYYLALLGVRKAMLGG